MFKYQSSEDRPQLLIATCEKERNKKYERKRYCIEQHRKYEYELHFFLSLIAMRSSTTARTLPSFFARRYSPLNADELPCVISRASLRNRRLRSALPIATS
jgi:hypothetical protein